VKNEAQPFYSQNKYITVSAEKVFPKIRVTSAISKKLSRVNNCPCRRKFAQSGHSA
jgi:hypothetical protein